MILKEYKKQNGEILKFPDNFNLTIEETSNTVYQIDLFDSEGRSVSDHGTNLDEMIEKALEDLKQMRK